MPNTRMLRLSLSGFDVMKCSYMHWRCANSQPLSRCVNSQVHVTFVAVGHVTFVAVGACRACHIHKNSKAHVRKERRVLLLLLCLVSPAQPTYKGDCQPTCLCHKKDGQPGTQAARSRHATLESTRGDWRTRHSLPGMSIKTNVSHCGRKYNDHWWKISR